MICGREATFEIYKDWPLDGRSALLYMVKHFEKHGGDGLNWLASWSRQKETSEDERTSIEMRCLVTCLRLSGTYDMLHSPCLASMGTVDQRSAQIEEAYSGEGGKPHWAVVHHHEGRTSAMDCIDPNLRVPARNWTLKTSAVNSPGVTGAGRQGGAATSAGDCADGEGTFAAKGGGRQRRRA